MPDSVLDNDWKHVEFRCMIQDILGNEIYKPIDSDKLSERTIYYCITIPGENDWVRKTTDNGFSHFEDANGEGDVDRLSFSLVNYSFPIPSDGKNRSCLIKIYQSNLLDNLRVNDIVHVTGLIEPDEFEDDAKLLTTKNSPKNEPNCDSHENKNGVNVEPNNNANANHNGSNRALNQSSNNLELRSSDMATEIEKDFEPASDFPHRLVPRVHVKTLRKLTHINPLLPEVLTHDSIDNSRIKLARARLSTILTQLLGGDTLAAEYLILSLISRIYRKKDVTTLGQLTIGLSGVTRDMKFLIEKLHELISRITTHSHFIDISIANLNNLRFTPKKDHDNNKMIAGTLQLPDGLYLVLNETALNEGQLTSQGLENLSTLNQIIRWQRHNYDFKYHSVEIDTDLKILVLSEGKSILDVPYQVKLERTDQETLDSIKQACESVNEFLTEDLLNMFRYYVTALMEAPEYSIPEDVQSLIQRDFAKWRAESKDKHLFSATDLSSYMTLARYLTISRGETTLTPQLWGEIRQMETIRTSRLIK